MKILSISDVQSSSLEKIIETNPEKYADIDAVISCGDLESDYIEFVQEGLRKPLFFVSGNHVFKEDQAPVMGDDVPKVMWTLDSETFKPKTVYIAGQPDLHGRVVSFGRYIMVGFGGSMWYNGKENQFTEKQMHGIVKRSIRKVFFKKFMDALLRRPKKEVIVVSHAPVWGINDEPDVCHSGFKCFRSFIKIVTPVLWLHGHVHTNCGQKYAENVKGTPIINAYGCKIVTIKDKDVEISAHC